jgi:hypothetical protein
LREDFYYLQAFVNMHLNFYRSSSTGLMYWEDDYAIGVDNDPNTFYRPHESSGSIFLNALMYKEHLATSYLADRLNLTDISVYYKREDLFFMLVNHVPIIALLKDLVFWGLINYGYNEEAKELAKKQSCF